MIEYTVAVRRGNQVSKRAVTFVLPHRRQTITLQALARHIYEHNKLLNPGHIQGVIESVAACVEEMILAGNKVDLGPLGTFAPDIECHGYAGDPQALTAEDIDVVTTRWGKPKAWKNLRQKATLQPASYREMESEQKREVRRRLKE